MKDTPQNTIFKPEKITHSPETDTIRRSAEAIGLIKGIQMSARILDASMIRAVKRIEDQKDWRGLYSSFADFLDNNDFLPFRRDKFYDLWDALEAVQEQDEVFNFLVGKSIPAKTILMLREQKAEFVFDEKAGTVSINGEKISNTRKAVRELISSMRKEYILLDHREKARDKKIEKLEKTVEEKDQHFKKNRSTAFAEFAADKHMSSRVELGLAFSAFTDAISTLSDIEKDQFRDGVLESIAAWCANVRRAYHTENSVKEVPTTLVGETFDEKFDNFIADIDLDAIDDNEAELAANL